MLSRELADAAYYTRFHYDHERVYTPRVVEEVLSQIEALPQTPDPEAASLPLLLSLLALRPRLPQPLSERLESIFERLAGLERIAAQATSVRAPEVI